MESLERLTGRKVHLGGMESTHSLLGWMSVTMEHLVLSVTLDGMKRMPECSVGMN